MTRRYIISTIILATFILGLWLLLSPKQKEAVSEQPTAPTDNSSYTIQSRSDDEYIQVIKTTYRTMASSNINVIRKELIQPHWFIVSITENDLPYERKYIFYDDYPNSSKIVISAPGLDQPDLPQAMKIPEDVIKQIEVRGL